MKKVLTETQTLRVRWL